MKLSQLKKGEKGIVIFIKELNKNLRRRMLDMGITKNVIVTIKKIAPLGNPICIELRGYELLLRKEELDSVEVEKL